MEKTCTKCLRSRSVGLFHRHPRGALGLDSICKACNKMRVMAWRTANPGRAAQIQRKYVVQNKEKVRASNATWAEKNGLAYERARYARRQTNPAQHAVYRTGQRAAKNRRRAAGPLSAATVRDVLKGPCAYCGDEATSVDHIIPVSRGGTNARENLAPACKSCNSKKAARTPTEWKEAA